MTPLPLIDIGGIWHITYFVGLAFAASVCVFKSDGLPLIGKLFQSYFLGWCLFLLEWPSIHFGVYTPYFQSTAGQAFAEGALIPFIAVELHEYITRAIPYLAGFAAVCVWLKYPGFMHAPSFNMALAAMCIPVITSPIVIGFIILTALSHHGSTALLIMGAQALAVALKGYVKWHWVLVGFSCLLISATVFQLQPAFNSGERIEHWIEYATFWAQDWRNVIFGIGPGSFVWYSVMTHKEQTGYFMQMHCDYLEVLWALGLVGFGLAVGVLALAVKRAWNQNIQALAGIFGCMAFMLTYQPLEYFPSALLTAYFFVRVLVIKDVEVKLTSFVWPIK